MAAGDDGSIHIGTKLDTDSLKPQLASMSKSISSTFASIRDVMQGPVTAIRMFGAAINKVGAVVNEFESEWANAEQSLAILNSTLSATGASAWTSSDQIQEFASQLQSITGYADDNIIVMQNVLLGFKNIKGDNFKEASVQILNMAKVMGMDLTSAAQAVGKALDDPINGVDSLSRQGFKFSDEQKKLLKSLVETGDRAKAQKIILDELATTYGGAAEAANNTGSAIKQKLGLALQDAKEQMGRAITEGISPLRLSLTNLLSEFTSSIKKMNDYNEAQKKIASGTATTSDYLTKYNTELENVVKAQKDAERTGYRGRTKQSYDAEIANLQSLVDKYEQLSQKELKASKEPAAVESSDESGTAWAIARANAEKAYSDELDKINLKVKIGEITTTESEDAKLAALKTEIGALEDIIVKYGLVKGATTDALTSALKGYQKIESIRNKTLSTPIEKQINTLEGVSKGSSLNVTQPENLKGEMLDFSAVTKSILSDLDSSWDSYFASIKNDASDWGDVVSSIGDMAGDLFSSAFETIGESIVTQTADWDDWGNAALNSMASVLSSLGDQLAAYAAQAAIMAVINLFLGNIAGAAALAAAALVAGAAAAAAYVGSGAVTALSETAEAEAEIADNLEDANDALKENRDLFTKASKAADAYDSVLSGLVDTVSDFYSGLQGVGSDIASTLIDSLVDGMDGDDFLYAMEEYITEAVIQAAVFTDTFTAEVAAIGTELATAIAGGADSSTIESLKNRLASLYETATAAATSASDIVASAFSSYAIGSLGLPSDGPIYAHEGEGVIPAGLMAEAMSAGLTIAPTASLMSGTNSLSLSQSFQLVVDGKAMSAVVYENWDDLVGASYGA